jgi:hypothetical protein
MNMAGMSGDASRLCCACGLSFAYLAVCVGVFLRAARKRARSGRDSNDTAPGAGSPPICRAPSASCS